VRHDQVDAMALRTALTDVLELQPPILLAPMAGVSGGALAAAVSHAGDLGFIGGGYGDGKWLERELSAAGNARVASAREAGDFDVAPVIVGEAVDLVTRFEPAADILQRMAIKAEVRLRSARHLVVDEPPPPTRPATIPQAQARKSKT
jgi:NAD(P)H-dependent flavin oxidoreductase YrpB (nitropropane dioxygenase family)